MVVWLLRFVVLFVLGQLCWCGSKSAAEDCPLELHPPTVVVKYGDPVSVNCTVSTGHNGTGWVANPGGVELTEGVQFVIWEVNNLKKWDPKPQCFVNLPDGSQCERRLSITVYKPPDSVSISSVNLTDHMVEGKPYQLKCDITNISPVQNLTVKWLKGNTSVPYEPEGVNYTEPETPTEPKTPQNVSHTLMITPSRADNGAEYRCVAELDLGDEGPRPPPKVQSGPLRITVLYKPTINNMANNVPVVKGYPEVLNCTAEGNPTPNITWSFNGHETSTGNILTISGTDTSWQGNYTCTATNNVGTHTKVVVVIFKEDYLPLIASLVLVMIIAIIIIFCSLYSVYYKNTKMGHYNLKDAKIDVQNGTVVQNGKNSHLPMKGLKQPYNRV